MSRVLQSFDRGSIVLIPAFCFIAVYIAFSILSGHLDPAFHLDLIPDLCGTLALSYCRLTYDWTSSLDIGSFNRQLLQIVYWVNVCFLGYAISAVVAILYGAIRYHPSKVRSARPEVDPYKAKPTPEAMRRYLLQILDERYGPLHWQDWEYWPAIGFYCLLVVITVTFFAIGYDSLFVGAVFQHDIIGSVKPSGTVKALLWNVFLPNLLLQWVWYVIVYKAAYLVSSRLQQR